MNWLEGLEPPSKDQPLTQETRDELVRKSHEIANLAEEAFSNLVSIRRTIGSNHHAAWPIVLNAFELIQMAEFEIAVLLSDMVSATSDLRTFLYSRLLLLSTYEMSKTLRGVLGQDFQEALSELGATAEERKKFREAHSAASQCYNRCEPSVRNVRRGVAAHRDPDAEVRLQLLHDAHPQLVAAFVIKFMVGLQSASLAENQFLARAAQSLRGDA